MQMKVIQLFWSQVQCHLESVLHLNTSSMDQARFQIGVDDSTFDSFPLSEPPFDWLRAQSDSINLKTYLRYWKSPDFSMECQ